MDRKLKNPKDSNVYRILYGGYYSTPSGSHIIARAHFYKHQIPSRLLDSEKLETFEANIQKGLAELKEFDMMGEKNPKDSNDCRIKGSGFYPTLKGSYVYNKSFVGFGTTPSGSHIIARAHFYKHQIPSGLLDSEKLETFEANIQKGLAELKELL